ncbi:hypothetical protein AAFC00_006609 [Neodothiora populina]|uniref:CCR4-Not complex 3'-5'-exoribonuclease subunit Ccr4 n=1 Tax=Neodothiora populina TaxID=2781224 RepID=A0ABR3PAV6_9PEZI
MADGAFRFQGAGQYFYNPQTQNRQIHTRHASPVNNPRIGFPSTDTPSPNRSPGTQSPAFAAMFGQNHNQSRHALLNGQSHQQYINQMNIAKQFGQHGHQHPNHHQNQQHHDHPPHNPHASAFGNHTHNISSGTLSSSTPHFTPSHLQSGTPSSNHSALSKPTSEFWAQQLSLAQESRAANQPHHYARNAHVISRQALASGQTANKEKEDPDQWRKIQLPPKPKGKFDAIDFSGQGLKGLSCNLFKYGFLEKLYLNQNKLQWIPAEIGLLRNLTFLDLSQNNLTELPAEIGMLTNLKTLLLVDNHLDHLPAELGYLYQLDTLAIEGNPLNDDIKAIVAESGPSELVRQLRETAPDPAPPNERDWISLEDDSSTVNEDDRLRVMSYNILCDKACTLALYGHAPTRALSWENRREQILNELQGRDADILCLQEIDLESFDNFFRPELARSDYKGVFWQKSRAQTMGEKDSRFVDGCATFYKNAKYILLDKAVVEFGRKAINRPDMKGEHDIFNRVMTRDDIATVTFLENRATGARHIVVNIHVFWNPAFPDVKVVQVAILLETLKQLSDTWVNHPPLKDKEPFKYANGDDVNGDIPTKQPAPSQKYSSGSEIPMIICGDFNSTPDSGVYDLLTHGSLSSLHDDLVGRKYGNFTKEGVAHPFSLKSSYAHINELEFTNYTTSFAGVLDYIWYSTNTLSVVGLLGDIDKQYLSRVPGFPHIYHPSDHISLMTEFVVKPRKEKKVVDADFGHHR